MIMNCNMAQACTNMIITNPKSLEWILNGTFLGSGSVPKSNELMELWKRDGKVYVVVPWDTGVVAYPFFHHSNMAQA